MAAHLLVAVGLQVGGVLAQAVLEAVLVALVEALAASLVDEGQQIHLGTESTAAHGWDSTKFISMTRNILHS